MLLLALLVAADPSAVWKIVHEQCVPNGAPCVSVGPHDAVLKDIRGPTHFLLVPTARLDGIESPALLAADAPNYFADAWKARELVSKALGKELRRDQIGIGVNAPRYRSQDQLHLHVDCLAPDVREAVQTVTSEKFAPIEIFDRRVRALRIRSSDLDGVNPFRLLASQLPPGETMADHSLMLVGTADGFVLVDSKSGGEFLLDRRCAIGR